MAQEDEVHQEAHDCPLLKWDIDMVVVGASIANALAMRGVHGEEAAEFIHDVAHAIEQHHADPECIEAIFADMSHMHNYALLLQIIRGYEEMRERAIHESIEKHPLLALLRKLGRTEPEGKPSEHYRN